MINHEELEDLYFSWLLSIVSGGRKIDFSNYTKLMNLLYSKEFYWLIPPDENRARDGQSLRYRFSVDTGVRMQDVNYVINGPCSVLEMMVALADRCEIEIMSDPSEGNRTYQWFWTMITNLDLHTFTNDAFNFEEANDIIDNFLDRQYRRDGRGGLFYIENSDKNLKNVEIWSQLMWYLDEIMGL